MSSGIDVSEVDVSDAALESDAELESAATPVSVVPVPLSVDAPHAATVVANANNALLPMRVLAAGIPRVPVGSALEQNGHGPSPMRT